MMKKLRCFYICQLLSVLCAEPIVDILASVILSRQYKVLYASSKNYIISMFSYEKDNKNVFLSV